jgi:hypothetical protein
MIHRHSVVLNANVLSQEPIREARDVSRGKESRYRGFEELNRYKWTAHSRLPRIEPRPSVSVASVEWNGVPYLIYYNAAVASEFHVAKELGGRNDS